MNLSGGEALVKSLVKEGVEVVFGIPGIQLYGVVAALRDEPSIRMVTTRHEQATTYMADGYARAARKPGVALVVPGVGVYNAASGLANAYARCSPVLLIAGQIPRAQIDKNIGSIHEVVDQPSVVEPVTKWRRRVMRPREMPKPCSKPSGRCAPVGHDQYSSKFRPRRELRAKRWCYGNLHASLESCRAQNNCVRLHKSS